MDAPQNNFSERKMLSKKKKKIALGIHLHKTLEAKIKPK